MANYITVGKTIQIQAMFSHFTGNVPTRSWTTSNAGIATVTAVGDGTKANVVGVAPGAATITLHAGSMTSTIAFTVRAVVAPSVRIKINARALN